jgi:hypothetical protein
MFEGRASVGGVVSQLTTFADTGTEPVLVTDTLLAPPPVALNPTDPVTTPVDAALTVTDRETMPLKVLLLALVQFDGSVIVPTVPGAAGVVLTPGPDAAVTFTVTAVPLANVCPLPARWIAMSIPFVVVEPMHTLPKLRGLVASGITPSPSPTTLSARALVAMDSSTAAATTTASARIFRNKKLSPLFRSTAATTWNRCQRRPDLNSLFG